ncbi:MAG: FeS-binding protein, partial [Flavobacteriales bacterium]
MINSNPSLSLSNPYPEGMNGIQKAGLALLGIAILLLLISWAGAGSTAPLLFLLLSFGLGIIGSLMYIVQFYKGKPEGVKNDNNMHNPLTSKGATGWLMGIVITGFYVLLYWFPSTLEGMIRIMDPLSHLLRGEAASQWFLYGTFYTVAILVMGVKAILKYKHSNYQIIRTSVIMFFQLAFAFLIPHILKGFNQPEFYFSYFWPLEHKYLFPSTVEQITSSGNLGIFMITWGAVMTFIGTPILTYFFGKRWYCSWVCGCGGLANTMG